MTKKPLKILAVVALLVVWLVPVEAQGAWADGAGFVERREGKLFHVEQKQKVSKDAVTGLRQDSRVYQNRG